MQGVCTVLGGGRVVMVRELVRAVISIGGLCERCGNALAGYHGIG